MQLENSPTLGSMSTTDYEKRQLAAQSLEYNLKDKMFCELFPDTVEVLFYCNTNLYSSIIIKKNYNNTACKKWSKTIRKLFDDRFFWNIPKFERDD